MLQGKPPAVVVVSELYQLLIEAGSRLRQPVALEEQLLKHNGLSSDVGKSMLQLLQVHNLMGQPKKTVTVSASAAVPMTLVVTAASDESRCTPIAWSAWLSCPAVILQLT